MTPRRTEPKHVIADAEHLWQTLAELRYEVAAAVSWIESGAEPSVALHRLRKGSDEALIALRELDCYTPSRSAS